MQLLWADFTHFPVAVAASPSAAVPRRGLGLFLGLPLSAMRLRPPPSCCGTNLTRFEMDDLVEHPVCALLCMIGLCVCVCIDSAHTFEAPSIVFPASTLFRREVERS